MKNFKKIGIILCIIFAILIPTLCIADVGDYESYDSGWDSSWDSSWDYDYDYGGYSGGYYGGDISIGTIIIIIIIVIIIAKYGKKMGINPSTFNTASYNARSNGYMRDSARSKHVAEQVRKVDTYFNEEKFIGEAKNLFVKLQTAWSERDWETIRPLESESLFEQHSKQLKGYIDRKQINKMERICVNFAELVNFVQDSEKDTLVVALNSSMTDYIIEEETGKVIKGDKDRRLTNTYKLTFSRKKGILTEAGTEEKKTTNCPNCGAPTVVTSSGKCEYCGCVITIGAHDWVLSDMERY